MVPKETVSLLPVSPSRMGDLGNHNHSHCITCILMGMGGDRIFSHAHLESLALEARGFVDILCGWCVYLWRASSDGKGFKTSHYYRVRKRRL